MALTSQQDDENIEKLCGEICRKISKQHQAGDITELVGRLRQLCRSDEMCGNGCDDELPAVRLGRLLRLGIPVTDYNIGLSVMDNYEVLAMEQHCVSTLTQLLSHSFTDLTSTSADMRKVFWARLWNCPGVRDIDVTVIEQFIQHKSSFLEEDILNIFQSVLSDLENSDKLWQREKYNKIIKWSSRSAKIFAITNAILYSCLRQIVYKITCYESCIKVIFHFVQSVKKECEHDKIDFVLLYPREFHTLVSLLDIGSEQHAGKVKTVVDLVRQSITCKPVQTLSILTHFPEWMPYII